MNNRIKEVRKSEKLTQAAFGERLGITQNYVALIEGGQREPSARTIGDICRVFKVSEPWLRTGAGQMHDGLTRAEEMAAEVARLMHDRPDSFKAAVVATLLRFDPDGKEWEVLERIYNQIAAEQKKE